MLEYFIPCKYFFLDVWFFYLNILFLLNSSVIFFAHYYYLLILIYSFGRAVAIFGSIVIFAYIQ